MSSRVVWIGKVARAELAVPCPYCGAEIGKECLTFSGPLLPGNTSHVSRPDRAHALGFRDVANAPLLDPPAQEARASG